MNDEIEVNDYIRTDDGYIAKVIRTDERGYFYCDSVVENYHGDEFDFFEKGDIYIEKHSPNITDLVQKKDYVNGHLVLEAHEDYIIIENSTASCYDGEQRIDIEDIETILTKEQFERIMYRVEE